MVRIVSIICIPPLGQHLQREITLKCKFPLNRSPLCKPNFIIDIFINTVKITFLGAQVISIKTFQWFVISEAAGLGQKPSAQYVHTVQVLVAPGAGFCFYLCLFWCSNCVWICNFSYGQSVCL